MNPVLAGFLASLAAGSMTAVGALPALLGRNLSPRTYDALLGFAAGVMIAASFFSLIIPALDISEGRGASRVAAASIVVAGVLLGVLAVALANEAVPHLHLRQGREGPRRTRMSRVGLLIAAITIHNLPEGMAVGVGFGAGDFSGGIALAVGIGLQNAPEGLAVAVALLSVGTSRWRAVAVAAATAAVEPLGGTIGAAAVVLAAPLLPWALAFAAGAMIYVVSHEIIPETHSRGYQNEATAGLAIGLVAMMFLDVTLG